MHNATLHFLEGFHTIQTFVTQLQEALMVSSGDHAPLFNLPNQDGERIVLRDTVGSPTVLVFYASDSLEACSGMAIFLKENYQELTALGVKLFSISADVPENRLNFAVAQSIPYPLLSDADFHLSSQYQVCKLQDASKGAISVTRTMVLLDPNLRIIKVYTPVIDIESSFQELVTDIKTFCPQEEPRVISTQAPVLVIPNVISKEFCRQLIQTWETQGNQDSGFMRRDGEETIGVIDYGMKVRRDHFVKDGALRRRLDRIVLNRICPEIQKCFNYTVTCCEDYKIARYEAEKGGYFRQHRDNTTGGTAHRVWAMTLNLNAEEYDGGHLRFSEYGPHLYKPETGSAVIFSCSMMHEATDVTSGERYALLAFFYGQKESSERKAYEAKHGTDSYKPVNLNE